jgi:hypothetical protein
MLKEDKMAKNKEDKAIKWLFQIFSSDCNRKNKRVLTILLPLHWKRLVMLPQRLLP